MHPQAQCLYLRKDSVQDTLEVHHPVAPHFRRRSLNPLSSLRRSQVLLRVPLRLLEVHNWISQDHVVRHIKLQGGGNDLFGLFHPAAQEISALVPGSRELPEACGPAKPGLFYVLPYFQPKLETDLFRSGMRSLGFCVQQSTVDRPANIPTE